MTLQELIQKSFENSKAHGFWDDCLGEDGLVHTEDVLKAIPLKLMLIVTELAEAMEDYRTGCLSLGIKGPDGKPEGFPVELADGLIRMGDLIGALSEAMGNKIPSFKVNFAEMFEEALKAKMTYNASRPYKHGKDC